MVKTGHPGAGACVGARRAPACAGTEAGGSGEGLWSRGGGVLSPTVLRACAHGLWQSWLRERQRVMPGHEAT